MLTAPTPAMASQLSAQTCYGIELEAYGRDLNGLMLATGAAIVLANKGLAPSVARLFWNADKVTAYVRLGASVAAVEAVLGPWAFQNSQMCEAVVCTIASTLGLLA